MLLRFFVTLSLLSTAAALAGDLPAKSYGNIDDAIAEFVSSRYKMKLLVPLGQAAPLKPGDVLLSKQSEAELGLWDLDEVKSCQSAGHGGSARVSNPISQSPYELTARFSLESKLLGLTNPIPAAVSQVKVWADQNFILIADDDEKSANTALALANCQNANRRATRQYVVNSLRAGRLHIVLQFSDGRSASTAKGLLEHGHGDFVIEHAEENTIELQMREKAVFAASVRPLAFP